LNDGEEMILEKPQEDEELEHLPDEWIYATDNPNEREEQNGDQDNCYSQQENLKRGNSKSNNGSQ
jgi:hypothetical protein